MSDAVLGRIPPDYSGYADQWNVFLAERITKDARNPRDEAQAILDYVKRHITYVPHPISTQVVKDARRCFESGEGDCVSMTVLIATLLSALNIPARFVAQYTDDEQLFTHVFCEAWIDGEWIALDAVAKDQPMGWIQRLPQTGFNLNWEIS